MQRMTILRSGVAVAAMLATVAISATQVNAGSQENFIAADRNNDNSLNRSEFRVFINKNARDGISPAPMIKEQNMYTQAFNMVDTDGNGLFSVEEARATSTTDWDQR